MAAISLVCPLVASVDVKDAQFDGVVVVTDTVDKLTGSLQVLVPPIKQLQQVDSACGKDVTVVYSDAVPSQRIIFSPTGPLNRDYDDVRRFGDAAQKGIARALKAGCRKPLLVRAPDKSYENATLVSVLGALDALYVPLEVREGVPSKAKKAEALGVWCTDQACGEKIAKISSILESGRSAYRDIGGSDPERMAAPRVAEYVEAMFKDTCIKVRVESDPEVFKKEYPLLEAVNRAASGVARHSGRVIHLEYVGEGSIDTTLMLVGKGITYDTGGADLKVGGCMAGMHRDKCGASFVAGFFQVLSQLQPQGLKVVGVMCMVRNSIGDECYVADEIITSRAGVRVRVGNTDAEGRMVMADLLCKMKEQAPNEVNPHLFTIATLTGHVIRAYGPEYTAILDNGPARKSGNGRNLFEIGESIGDPFEISTMRREDFEFHKGKSEYEDVLQCNNAPSTMTARGHMTPSAFLAMSSGVDQDFDFNRPKSEYEDVHQAMSNGKPSGLTNRGHQIPAAFIHVASGLDKHGLDSAKPLKYTHLDIAGSSGPFPGTPTGRPVVAMAQAFVLGRELKAVSGTGKVQCALNQ